ncbi:MAG TPA: DUF3455 domain-containing protein [Polyangia bacterium]|nr:DUF3455 domain-containing protein [Polyangia bacterium]
MLRRLLVLVGWCVLESCASLTPPSVSAPLRAPDDERVVLRADARGVQIYDCRMALDGSGWEWVLRGPEADLRGDPGRVIVRHYAGPTWEAADGSKVVGELVRRLPAPKREAVPWLLLRAQKTEGSGVLAGVTWIQCVDTQGGQAPALGCDGGHAGASARVPYRATYYFYGRR